MFSFNSRSIERNVVPILLVLMGGISGAASVLFLQEVFRRRRSSSEVEQDRYWHEKQLRIGLPRLIIFVRHGESEGNADHTLWRTKADNLLKLSPSGKEQARAAGERIEELFQGVDGGKDFRRIHLVVSPFDRTIQTSSFIRQSIEHRIVRTEIEPRIREQEFGNLQGDEFKSFREEQKKVGRFWYRFPTGESGADVYDRVKSWWFESVLNVNTRVGYEPVDALVVVTHGLTMRFALMQLFQWSPITFHSVWNAGNCEMYVLRKDMEKPGLSPYVLDDSLGDHPKSSIQVIATLSNGKKHELKLDDYLSIPPPRTMQIDLIKTKISEQYPGIPRKDIEDVSFVKVTGGLLDFTNEGASRRTESPLQRESSLEWAKKERSIRCPNLR